VAEPGHQETLAALGKAAELSRTDIPAHEAIQELGEGWVAEEALAISVYCALVAESFEQGVVIAVNHSGDTPALAGATGAPAGD